MDAAGAVGPPATLRGWQEMFRGVYAGQDRWRSPADIWLRVVEGSGALARGFRLPGDRDEILPLALPDLMVWLFGMANRLGFDLADATWSKFPALCPYCFERSADETLVGPDAGPPLVVRPCVCAEGVKSRGYSRVRDEFGGLRSARTRPSGLDGWQAMFRGVYGGRHGDDLDRLAYHFIEEVGEVATEVRYQRYDACADEIADMFSWVLSLANAAGLRGGRRVSVADALWNQYPGVCRTCREAVCKGAPRGTTTSA